jgi:hypothetical protein
MPKPCLAVQHGKTQTAASEDMEIAKALWQLSYAMLIFAGYLIFMIFVAPFGFGFATFVSAWSSFRGGKIAGRHGFGIGHPRRSLSGRTMRASCEHQSAAATSGLRMLRRLLKLRRLVSLRRLARMVGPA